MAAFKETATERLLREERERQRLLGGDLSTSLSALFPKQGTVEAALSEAVRPILDQQRLLDTVDPLRGLRGALAEALHDPVRDQLAAISRGYGAALGTGFDGGTAHSTPAAALSSPTPTKRQGTLTTAADLGPLIRKARKAMKLSQGEFAAHAGVGRRFVSELESGKASLEFDKVLACAAAAGIDIVARPRSAG
jgi:y4mF family transcriptional regulator